MDETNPARTQGGLPKWVRFVVCNESGQIERGAAWRIAFHISWAAFAHAVLITISLLTLQTPLLRWAVVLLIPFALCFAGLAVWHWMAILWVDRNATWQERG